ncbi:MAG: hypothetical protein ACOCVZ_08150 [Gemmatimonadota bacterium]
MVAALIAMVTLGTLACLARPAAAQEGAGPGAHVAAHAGISLRQGFEGFRVASDLRTAGVRLTWARDGASPWLDGTRFVRPDLECPASTVCNAAGWLVRAGVTLPLTMRPGHPGPQPQVSAGLGATLSEGLSLSYLLAFGVVWQALVPRLSPFIEFRWEHVTGLNLGVAAVGLRVDL